MRPQRSDLISKFFNLDLKLNLKLILPYSLKCIACDKTYANERSLRIHIGRHQGVLKHKCPECIKTFNGRSEVNRHMVAIHGRALNTDEDTLHKKIDLQQAVKPIAIVNDPVVVDDDEAIITGTGMVVAATAGNTAGVLEHDEGQHTPEFKVWPEGHLDEESSRNSGASSQQPQTADLLSNIQQQPSTTSTSP